MKGTLIKKPEGWFVKYEVLYTKAMAHARDNIHYKELPLHPDDIPQGLVDSIWAEGLEVEFEVVREGEKSNTKLTKDTYLFVTKYYAKLIQQSKQEESSWDDIWRDYQESPEGLHITDWLDKHYFIPKKK